MREKIIPLPERIAPTTQMVVTETATEKVMDLPVGSILLLSGVPGHLSTVLHRTGPDGWLSTRPLSSSRGGYLKNNQVREALEKREADGSVFTLLAKDGGGY